MNRVPGITPVSVVVCLALLAGGSTDARGAARADDPPGKGPAELQGCWKLVSVEAGGKATEPVGGGQPRWVVKGDTVYYGGESVIRFTADPSTSPRVIDLKFRDPDRVYE